MHLYPKLAASNWVIVHLLKQHVWYCLPDVKWGGVRSYIHEDERLPRVRLICVGAYLLFVCPASNARADRENDVSMMTSTLSDIEPSLRSTLTTSLLPPPSPHRVGTPLLLRSRTSQSL
jgi:hypothetical protein